MSRIAGCFKQLKAQGKKALIPFITAGDPHPNLTVDLMHALVQSGADILELGVPFSDPMADGPVIQAASERALMHNVSLRDVLKMVTAFRQQDTTTPVVLMGYLNPVEIMGYETFTKAAQAAGVDGLLTVDLPPEESAEVLPLFRQYGIDPIYLLSPTTTEKRVQTICQYASGFVYYVSVKGVTGSGALNIDAVNEKLAMISQHTQLPLAVGFGIKTPETAAQMAKTADAVVVGSALVKQIETLSHEQVLSVLPQSLQAMRSAMDEA